MPKNIVVCCDGTTNQFGDVNTNVVKTFQLIERRTERQIAFYDPGVGTVGALGWAVGEKVGKFMGMAFGYGVKKNIEDAYRFLMDNYDEGDKVFLFGFSRGAFTARSLAAMLHKVGLLYPRNENLIPYASKYYLTRDNEELAENFKRTFARECATHFLGVWDTVGSLGIMLSMRQFHNMKLSPGVSYGYHAVAIDEKRRKFRPALWETENRPPEQTIEQIWFAGVHADVGGGYRKRGLADVTLKWMLENAEKHGLHVNHDEVEPDALGTIHRSYKGLWLPLGWHTRQPPPRGDPAVHASVSNRLEADIGYDPSNLP